MSSLASTLFRADQILFTALGYPMSALEFIGTALNLLSVWLVARKNIWTWPVGLLAAIWFGILFYQVQLYSDLIVQVYFFVTNIYGWLLWAQPGQPEGKAAFSGISRNVARENLVIAIVIVVGTITLGAFMSRVHLFFPSLFSRPAAFPYVDAWETVMSFIAQMLLAHRRLESWYLWIAVDVISVGLYGVRGIFFVALLYAVFLFMAVRGLLNWQANLKRELLGATT